MLLEFVGGVVIPDLVELLLAVSLVVPTTGKGRLLLDTAVLLELRFTLLVGGGVALLLTDLFTVC